MYVQHFFNRVSHTINYFNRIRNAHFVSDSRHRTTEGRFQRLAVDNSLTHLQDAITVKFAIK